MNLGTVNLRLTWTTSGILWITWVPAVLSYIHQKGSFLQQGRNKHLRGQKPPGGSHRDYILNLLPQTWGGVNDTPLLRSEILLFPLLLTLGPWKLACLAGTILKPTNNQSLKLNSPGMTPTCQTIVNIWQMWGFPEGFWISCLINKITNMPPRAL